MAENKAKSETTPKPVDTVNTTVASSSSNNKSLLIFLGIGCFILLLCGATVIVGSMILRRVGQSAGNGIFENIVKDGVEKGVENATGTDFTDPKLPKDYPNDAPTYSNAKISYSSSNGDGANISVTYSTKDSADTILAFYKSNLEDNGWEITSQGSVYSDYLNATKDDKNFYISVFETTTKGSDNTFTVIITQ